MSVDINVTEITADFSLANVVSEANDLLKKWLHVSYDIPIVVGESYQIADLVDLQNVTVDLQNVTVDLQNVTVDLQQVKAGNDVSFCMGTRDEELGFSDGFFFFISKYEEDYRYKGEGYGAVYAWMAGRFHPVSACLMLAIATATAFLCHSSVNEDCGRWLKPNSDTGICVVDGAFLAGELKSRFALQKYNADLPFEAACELAFHRFPYLLEEQNEHHD